MIFRLILFFFLVVLINLVSPSPVVLINLVSPSLQTKVMCDGAVGWFNRNPFSGLQNRWSADRLALSVYLSISLSLSFSLSLSIFLSLSLSLSLFLLPSLRRTRVSFLLFEGRSEGSFLIFSFFLIILVDRRPANSDT